MERLVECMQQNSIERIFLPFVALQVRPRVVRARVHTLSTRARVRVQAVCEAALEAQQLPRALKQVITAGEQLLSSDAVREFFTQMGEGCSLHNHYGVCCWVAAWVYFV